MPFDRSDMLSTKHASKAPRGTNGLFPHSPVLSFVHLSIRSIVHTLSHLLSTGSRMGTATLREFPFNAPGVYVPCCTGKSSSKSTNPSPNTTSPAPLSDGRGDVPSAAAAARGGGCEGDCDGGGIFFGGRTGRWTRQSAKNTLAFSASVTKNVNVSRFPYMISYGGGVDNAQKRYYGRRAGV